MKLIRISSAFVRHTLFGWTMTPRDIMLQWPGPAGPAAWCLMTWEVSSSCSQAAADPGLAVTSRRLDSGNCGEMWRNNRIRPRPDCVPWNTRVANNIFLFYCSILIKRKTPGIKCWPLATCSKLPHSPSQPSSATSHDDHMLHVQFCSIHSWHDSWLRCWSGLGRVSRPAPGM